MKLLLLFAAMSGIFFYFSLPAFELTFGALLLTPVIAHLLGLMMPLSSGVYFGVVIVLAGLLVFLCSKRMVLTRDEIMQREGPTVAFFFVAYTCAWAFCMRWPDFVAIGERLRDYAILSSVLDSPVKAVEPWMSGSVLNYYIYWYRFGHMLSKLLFSPVWEVYPMLAAFSISAYATIAFRLFSRWLGFSIWNSIFCTLLIAVGSNLAGVWAFLARDDNWWGPSRVIPGTINEFPAWSFLLGDIHPHYLNLALIPFFVLLFLRAGTPRETRPMLSLSPERMLFFLGLSIVPFLWIYNANAWEVPMWSGLLVVLFTVLSLATRGRFLLLWKRGFAHFGVDVDERGWVILLLIAVCTASLYHSSLNISPEQGSKVSLVAGEIARSGTLNLLKHWGFPLALILGCNLLLIRQTSMRVVAFAILGGSLMMREALAFLIALLVFNCLRLSQMLGFEGEQESTPPLPSLVMEALGIGAIGLIILPEIAFIRDAYGGGNERMNTIFKIYTTCWFLLHAFAFYMASLLSSRKFFQTLKGWPTYAVQAVVLICFVGFFYRTVPLREQNAFAVEPRIEGLSSPEAVHPGSAWIIRGLREMRAGIVLEAQGPPYSYTSLISTLSGNLAYLGWANHVNLLVRNYAEVSRREKMTETIYKESDCLKRLELVRQEGISYLVLGTLEKKQYPGSAELDYSCFKQFLHDKDYTVYGLK